MLRAGFALSCALLAASGCTDPGCSGYYADCVRSLPLGGAVSGLALVPAQNVRLACPSNGRFFATHPGWNCRGACVAGLPESDLRACGGPQCHEQGFFPPECGEYLVFAGSDGLFNCGAFVQDGGIVAVRAFCAD